MTWACLTNFVLQQTHCTIETRVVGGNPTDVVYYNSIGQSDRVHGVVSRIERLFSHTSACVLQQIVKPRRNIVIDVVHSLNSNPIRAERPPPFLPSYASLDTRILVRNVLRAQTPTRHRWHAIDARVGRDMASVTQIATPTNLDTDILIQGVKSVFDLRARHAHGESCFVIAGPYGSATAIGGFEETVGDGIHPRRQDVRRPGLIEEGIVELAVGEPTGLDAERRA